MSFLIGSERADAEKARADAEEFCKKNKERGKDPSIKSCKEELLAMGKKLKKMVSDGLFKKENEITREYIKRDFMTGEVIFWRYANLSHLKRDEDLLALVNDAIEFLGRIDPEMPISGIDFAKAPMSFIAFMVAFRLHIRRTCPKFDGLFVGRLSEEFKLYYKTPCSDLCDVMTTME